MQPSYGACSKWTDIGWYWSLFYFFLFGYHCIQPYIVRPYLNSTVAVNQ